VIAAAERRFVDLGYAATTIAAVADDAGVSAETVYLIFKNKRVLLEAVIDSAVTGSSDGGGLVGGALIQRIREERDQHRRFALMVDATRDVLRRSARINQVVRDAAAGDAEIAELQRSHDRQTLRDVRRLVRLLAEVGPLRVSEADAVDRMWVLAQHSDFYRSLTTTRRWSHHRAFAALADTIARSILFD